MQTAAHINRILCAHDGRMELEELYGQLLGLELKDEVEDALKDTDMFVITGEENKVVVAKTKLRLCRVRDCQGCSNLHLCKMYLLGDCPFEKERGCRFCHDLSSEHNKRALQEHNLLGLDRSELCIILLQNDNTLLPPVCFAYNKGSGEYGHCSDKEACVKLHVCENYIRGTCDGSTKCSRSHDFYEPHSINNFAAKRIPIQLVGSVLPAYSNRLIIWDSNRVNNSINPTNAADKSEICLYHIRKFCKRGNGCQRVHYHLPYKWEGTDGHNWKVLPDNEEIEKAFCDPAKMYSDGTEPVYFDTMIQGFAEVRRLSTVSSVLNPTFILTTTWIWYWEDDNRNWIQYGSSDGTHHKSSITSEDVERKYQEDNSATVEFTSGQHSYDLNMQDMMQYNRQKGSKRAVRRRPVFLSAEDVQKIKTRGLSQNSRALPHHWDKTSMPETGFKRVPLKNTSEEYKKIIELFNQTMSGFSVKSIERVQNQDLWNVFQWQEDVMKKKTVGRENEKLLFHGTEYKHIDAICQQNFDWRICGVHGTAYGKGSYFARDANYSHRYTNDSGPRCMFVCRVLVGEYTTGLPSHVRPPLKDGGDTVFFDSCVNDINNPSIFVVFEKHQVYPEYLIQYENKAGNNPEHILVEELSQMGLASSDDESVLHQLSRQSSYSSITSEESVESVCTDPDAVAVTGPAVVPKFHVIHPHRALRSACLKSRPLKCGRVRLTTHSRLIKSSSVRNFPNSRTHQRRLKTSGSLASPENMPTAMNTALSLGAPIATQEWSVLSMSANESSPVPSSAESSTYTNPSDFMRKRNTRKNRPNTRGLLTRRRPKTTSASTSASWSGDIKTSNLVSCQNNRPKRQKGVMSPKAICPVTLGTDLSAETKTSNPGERQYARQIRPDMTRSSSETKTSNPVGSQKKARHNRGNMTRSSDDTKTSNPVGSQKNAGNNRPNMTRLSADTKTSDSVRNTRQDKPNFNQSTRRLGPGMASTSSSTSTTGPNSAKGQNAKQQRSNLAQTAKGPAPPNSSANLLPADTKTPKSGRSQNIKQEMPRSAGGVSTGATQTSKPATTGNPSQQKSNMTRPARGLNPATSSASSNQSTRSSTSKSVKSDGVKTQSTTPSAKSKSSGAAQKTKTAGKGSKGSTPRR
ncbi:protein mono-ADP-ribosyltransferase PARP12 [Astyanax mexicanus]|uniref:protein mono-ADP-ribosyltransferase PARP12 n=1 Tax=Astyanax mexicanus TaxID=7994 RepID=UPI0020CAF4C8|nr:protein mono-ADP-ribosyltransferase PARP12 [Astyanax mexicanus]